jgi:large subunit ribosomal protein L24
MAKIKKNDTVVALAGKDKGKQGRVIAVYGKDNKILVEGVNFVKKHARKQSQEQQGGIVSKEMPIPISNVMVICKSCSRPTRVGTKILEDKSKVRICKKCKEALT